jgi:poly(beta-D-mannuronate) lyase
MRMSLKVFRALLVVSTVGAWSAQAARAVDRAVATLKELDEAINDAKPGDTITLRDGQWKDFDVLFDAEGTAEAPITLRAEAPGKVILSGPTSLRIGGRHLVVSGLYFRETYNDDHLVVFRRNSKQLAEHCRLTECVLENCNHPTDAGESRWVSLYGAHNRVDHCSIAGKTSKGTTLVAFLGEEPNHHRIDHNYFGPREKLGKNGGETIRIGDSDTAHLSSQTIVESNCFEQCNGEAEIISNKSCDNVYRWNTFLRCSGALTLRHGNAATVEGNFFLGEKARGTGGVRIIGERHRVVNNFFSDLEGDDHRAALSLMNGFKDSPADGYAPVKNAEVAFNTFINCKQTIVVGLSEEDGPDMPPEDCTIANNLIVTRRTAVDILTKPVDCRWNGNLVQGQVGVDFDGVRGVDDLKLKRTGSLWSLTAASPAVDAAAAGFKHIGEDIQGRPRSDPKDVGCEELSGAPPRRGPIDPEDVGAGWRAAER